MNEAVATPPRPTDEARVEAVFATAVAARMEGLPFLNDALRVEALGFRDWQGVRVGALVTPWSINLLILPGPGRALVNPQVGTAQPWAFPSGHYEFLGHEEPELGRYQQCSLFSPALEFSSHELAVDAARAALEALFAVPESPRVSRRGLLLGA